MNYRWMKLTIRRNLLGDSIFNSTVNRFRPSEHNVKEVNSYLTKIQALHEKKQRTGGFFRRLLNRNSGPSKCEGQKKPVEEWAEYIGDPDGPLMTELRAFIDWNLEALASNRSAQRLAQPEMEFRCAEVVRGAYAVEFWENENKAPALVPGRERPIEPDLYLKTFYDYPNHWEKRLPECSNCRYYIIKIYAGKAMRRRNKETGGLLTVDKNSYKRIPRSGIMRAKGCIAVVTSTVKSWLEEAGIKGQYFRKTQLYDSDLFDLEKLPWEIKKKNPYFRAFEDTRCDLDWEKDHPELEPLYEWNTDVVFPPLHTNANFSTENRLFDRRTGKEIDCSSDSKNRIGFIAGDGNFLLGVPHYFREDISSVGQWEVGKMKEQDCYIIHKRIFGLLKSKLRHEFIISKDFALYPVIEHPLPWD